jgi:hypothetical protein
MGNPEQNVCIVTSHFTISGIHHPVISNYRKQGVHFSPCKESIRMAFT